MLWSLFAAQEEAPLQPLCTPKKVGEPQAGLGERHSTGAQVIPAVTPRSWPLLQGRLCVRERLGGPGL